MSVCPGLTPDAVNKNQPLNPEQQLLHLMFMFSEQSTYSTVCVTYMHCTVLREEVYRHKESMALRVMLWGYAEALRPFTACNAEPWSICKRNVDNKYLYPMCSPSLQKARN